MNHFLEKYERDFLVCSDCAYFINEKIIDERYPKIVKGKCKLHNKIVDNRWETNCKDNTYYCQCNMCKYFSECSDYNLAEDTDFELDNYPYECSYKNIPIEEDGIVCEYFKEISY